MGGLSRSRAVAAVAGDRSVAAVRAATALRRRGVFVSRAELGRRTLAECIDAINWSRNGRPLDVRPPWIGELLGAGRARLVRGVCRACGCSERRACVWGEGYACDWAPSTPPRTLCSLCAAREGA